MFASFTCQSASFTCESAFVAHRQENYFWKDQLALVIQRVDNAIHLIHNIVNHYPAGLA